MDERLIAPAPGSRVFERTMRPALADCAPTGRIRLDALARWLQDIAYEDVEDAGLQFSAVWVVRRSRIRVQRFPRFSEPCLVQTFCSGIGRMWAERRTTIRRLGAAPEVEAVSLWVHLDPLARRPTPLTQAELDTYGATGSDRRVSARLRHPPADRAVAESSWTFRQTELDLADHINNAAYWQPLEAELVGGPEPLGIDVEVEFRTPTQPGSKRILTHGPRRWILEADGEAVASILVSEVRLPSPQRRLVE